ncbi:MAG: CARDB domain-containing protein [Gammaproteobacteria bacterium]
MKKFGHSVSILILSILLVACTPDLVVRNLTVNWDNVNKKAFVDVENRGNGDATYFMVYFNGDEYPESRNRRPQVRHNVPNLGANQSIRLEADFAPLAHPDNFNLDNVYQITVLADPKWTVDESNEDNNIARTQVITSTVELYDRNGNLVPESPTPIPGNALPVLFVHGHNLISATDDDFNYRKNWQQPLDYSGLLKLPSFKIALDLQQNSNLNIEPYYIRFQDQHRSIIEDAGEIDIAIKRILQRHNSPEASNGKVVIVAYSKGTISSRWYLKNIVPLYQPVSEFIAIASPNHGLSSGGSNLASRQLSNGFDSNCSSYNEIYSENFIERLNGHPITDSMTDSRSRSQYSDEAFASRADNTPADQGVLYLNLYANNNRDFVGGNWSSGDCQGRKLAKNLALNAVNLEVPEIIGLTELGVHANTVHTHQVICKALYMAVHHSAPANDLSCTTVIVDGRKVPVIPVP